MNDTSVAVLGEANEHGFKSRLGRTRMGDTLLYGIAEPEELEPDVLLKGKVHQIFTGPGNGKTWVALWLIKRAIERGETAMYFDMENGKRIILERLQELEVDPLYVDEYLYYYDFPTLGIDPYAQANYRDELDVVQPDLLVFDSWVGFLAGAGLDENSPTQVEEWASAYLHPAKAKDGTVVILDHVPHDANRSRGATRKKDLVDVQWNLSKQQPFDRSKVGYIQLKLEKDREGWLPAHVGFSIGGTEEGFMFKRSEGVVPDRPGDGLTPSARKALEALETFGEVGTTYSEWHKAIEWQDKPEMPDSTFRLARERLITRGLVWQDDDRYYSNNSNQTAIAVDAVGQKLQHRTATPPVKGVAAAVDDGNSYQEVPFE